MTSSKVLQYTAVLVELMENKELHVAAGSKATPQLIKLLADAYPGACDVQDEDGRTPLHFACYSSCELFQDDHMKTCTPPSNMSIRALLSVSMRAATLEDVDEMNAIEYAIMSNASLQTIKLLQKASIRHFTGKTFQRQMHEF